MREDIRDLIPFYVAGTLTEEDRRLVEAYLREGEDYRAELEDWQAIAQAVREEVDPKGHRLPPISERVRASLSQPVAALDATQPAQPVSTPTVQNIQPVVVGPARDDAQPSKPKGKPRRNVEISFTLAAAVVVFVAMGVLFVVWNQLRTQQPSIDGENPSMAQVSTVAMPPTEINGNTGSGPSNDGPEPDGPDGDLGILAPVMTNTPLPPVPSQTPMPPTAVLPTPFPLPSTNAPFVPSPGVPMGGGGENLAGAELAASESGVDGPVDAPEGDAGAEVAFAGANTGQCTVTNNSSQSIIARQYAGEQFDSLTLVRPGESLTAYVFVFDASGETWYEAVNVGQGLAGWVRASEVLVSGDCTALILPTPTQAGVPGFATPFVDTSVCRVSSAISVQLTVYGSPQESAPVIGTMRPHQILEVRGQSNNGWFQVFNTNRNRAFTTGWVPMSSVVQNGDCTNLPVLDAQPSRTPPPSPTIVFEACQVRTADGRGFTLRGGPGDNYALVGEIPSAQAQTMDLAMRAENGWLLLREPGAVRSLGWVNGSNAFLVGRCDLAPLISLQLFQAQETPIATWTPAAQ